MFHFQSCSVKAWNYATKDRLNSIEQDMPGHPPKHTGGLCHQLGLSSTYKEELFLKAGSGLYKLAGENRFTDLNFHKNRVKSSKSRTFTAGYEAMFTPPKSWSVAHAYADEETKKLIMQCLEGANKKMLEEIEKRAGVIVQRDGVSEFHSSKIAATTFTHGNSRDGDSYIHFHNYIKRAVWNPVSNELQGSGLNTQRIREAELLIGSIARQELIKLAKERGLAVQIERTLTRTGEIDFVPELAGVPTALVEAHSSASRRIENELNKTGKSLKTVQRKTAVLTNQITRPLKQARTQFEEDLRNREILVAAGFSQDYVVDATQGIKKGTKTVREPLEVVNGRLGYTHYQNASEALDAGIAHIIEREAVIASKSDLIAVALKQSNYVFEEKELEKAFDEKVEKKELIYRYPECVASGQDFYADGKRIKGAFSLTTKLVLEQEKTTIDLYRKSIQTRQAVSTAKEVENAIKEMEAEFKKNLSEREIESGKGKLTQGQVDMVYSIMMTTDAVLPIEGWAGSGKTTAAKVVQNLSKNELMNSTKDLVQSATTLVGVANRAGFNVVGIAPSNQARSALNEAGIQTSTMQSLVRNGAVIKRAWEAVNEKTIIVADESSMWGTLDFNAIVEETLRRGARIAFIGDREQLQSPLRGAPYSQIADVAEEMGRKVTLTQEQRSRTQEAKTAHFLARTDQVAAIEFLEKEGAVFQGSQQEQIEYIVEELKGLSLDELYKTPVIVDTNKARIEMTRAIRSGLGFQNEVTLNSQEVLNFTRAELLNVNNYEEGFIITMRSKSGEFKPQEKLTVLSVEKNFLTVERESGMKVSFDPAYNGLYIQSIGIHEEVHTSVGESIRFTGGLKSLEGVDIINGDRARVDEIDKKKKVIKCSLIDFDGKKTKEFSFNYGNKKQLISVRNGFASTIHSLQGATINRGFYLITNTSKEALHTAITRFRGQIADKKWSSGIKIVCKSVDSKLKELVKTSIRKLEALPKQDVIRKIAPVNAFILPSAFENIRERALNEVRVPKVLENDSTFIAEKMAEFKESFGKEMMVTGSPAFISKVEALTQNLGVELVRHVEAIQDKKLEQEMDIQI